MKGGSRILDTRSLNGKVKESHWGGGGCVMKGQSPKRAPLRNEENIVRKDVQGGQRLKKDPEKRLPSGRGWG